MMPCDQGNEASWIRGVKTSEPIKLFDQGTFKYKSNQAKNKCRRRSKDSEKVSGELVVSGTGHAKIM